MMTSPKKATKTMTDRSMSDAMLHEIALLDFPENDSERLVEDHFDAYSDSDLLIASKCAVDTHNSDWMRQVLRWDGTEETWTMGVPPPRISERLAVCLQVLDFHLELVDTLYGAGALEAAQMKLNDILLEHPVLLHPHLRIHFELMTTKGTCSVAHAIALSRNGRFPMERDGLTQEQLADFVNHPCVRLGLTSRQPGHRGALRDADGSTALVASINRQRQRAGFLASLHRLDELFDRDAPGSRWRSPNPLLRSLWKNVATGASASEISAISTTYAAAFLTGLGLYRQPQPGSPPTRDPAFPEFLELVAEENIAARLQLRDKLRLLVHPSIFYDAAVPVPADQVHDSVLRIVDGLVTAKLEDTPAQAARWLRDVLGGQGFPRASVEQALAYVRALAERGVHDCHEFFAGVIGRDQPIMANADAWLEAARIYTTEVGMKAVIDQAVGRPREAAAERSAPARRRAQV